MIYPRVPSLATAATSAIFTMAGAVLFAGDAQSQGEAPAQQAQPDAIRPAATAEAGAGGQPGLGLDAPVPAPVLGDVSPGVVFPAEHVAGFSAEQPARGDSAPPLRMPQNRAVPPNADNAAHHLPGAEAYSSNWLVDGMARLEADEKRQRAGNARDGGSDDAEAVDPLTGKPGRDRDIDRDAGNPGDKSGAAVAAQDPLAQYLQKWMATSSGAAAVAAAAVVARPSDFGGGQHQANPGDAAGADSAISGAPRPTDGRHIAAQMTQPILEATGPSIVLPPPPVPQPNAAQNTMPATDPAPQPATGIPANATLKIKPIEPAQEPAKPVVNDKKYFPQLRRF